MGVSRGIPWLFCAHINNNHYLFLQCLDFLRDSQTSTTSFIAGKKISNEALSALWDMQCAAQCMSNPPTMAQLSPTVTLCCLTPCILGCPIQ